MSATSRQRVTRTSRICSSLALTRVLLDVAGGLAMVCSRQARRRGMNRR